MNLLTLSDYIVEQERKGLSTDESKKELDISKSAKPRIKYNKYSSCLKLL